MIKSEKSEPVLGKFEIGRRKSDTGSSTETQTEDRQVLIAKKPKNVLTMTSQRLTRIYNKIMREKARMIKTKTKRTRQNPENSAKFEES